METDLDSRWCCRWISSTSIMLCDGVLPYRLLAWPLRIQRAKKRVLAP